MACTKPPDAPQFHAQMVDLMRANAEPDTGGEGVLARLFYGNSKRLSEGLSLRAKERHAGMPSSDGGFARRP